MKYEPKAFIVKQFLTEDEVLALRLAVKEERENNSQHHLHMKWEGRIAHNLHKLPESINNKFLQFAKENGDPDFVRVRVNSFIYSGKYGSNTHLRPHQDEGELLMTINCQLESNVDWPLIVEGEKFVLKDGDALIFGGNSQVHWREEKFLSPDEFVDMFSLSFSYPDYFELVKSGDIPDFKKDVNKRIADGMEIYNPSIDVMSCHSKDQIDHSMCGHK